MTAVVPTISFCLRADGSNFGLSDAAIDIPLFFASVYAASRAAQVDPQGTPAQRLDTLQQALEDLIDGLQSWERNDFDIDRDPAHRILSSWNGSIWSPDTTGMTVAFAVGRMIGGTWTTDFPFAGDGGSTVTVNYFLGIAAV